jgi:hypothetical protein
MTTKLIPNMFDQIILVAEEMCEEEIDGGVGG